MSRLSEEEIAGMRNQIKAGRTVWTHILMERLLADRETWTCQVKALQQVVSKSEAELATLKAELAAVKTVSLEVAGEIEAFIIRCGKGSANMPKDLMMLTECVLKLENKSAGEGEG
jgi:prophage DNA circulation protein